MAGKPRTRVAKWWGLVVIIILVAGGVAPIISITNPESLLRRT